VFFHALAAAAVPEGTAVASPKPARWRDKVQGMRGAIVRAKLKEGQASRA
jgi:hypothetical protein